MTPTMQDSAKVEAGNSTAAAPSKECGASTSAGEKSAARDKEIGVRKILVAVDRIDHPALRFALTMAAPLQAQVEVVFALEPEGTIRSESEYLYTRSLEEYAQLKEQRIADAKSMLKEIESSLPDNARAIACLREGHAADEILNAAQEWGADLIVMGTHRKGALARAFLGSTSLAVIRHGRVPVLLVDENTMAKREVTA